MAIYLAITFGVLALWRIMIQSFGFMAGSRAIYLIVAILAIVDARLPGHLGGVLVYDYGAGTALMAAAPVPSEAASPAAEPSAAGPIPTVSVPTAEATSTRRRLHHAAFNQRRAACRLQFRPFNRPARRPAQRTCDALEGDRISRSVLRKKRNQGVEL